MGNVEDMDRMVESEFIDEVRDILDGTDVLIGNLRSHIIKPQDGIAQIRRDMFNMEMRATSLELPLVSIIAHRLGEYAADLKTVDDHILDDIQSFIDNIRSILEGRVEASQSAKVIRELPRKTFGDFNPGDVVVSNVEVLLIIPDKATCRIVERELAACGYRTSNIRSPFQAIEVAVRTRPDMIIVSGVLDDLSGVDVASALAAMPTTRDLPLAILTSYTLGHPSLDNLPAKVPVIRKGAQFGEDLADAFSRLHIT